MFYKIIKNRFFLGLVIFLIGIAVGRFSTPTKTITKIKTKTVEIIKEVKIKDKTKSKQNNTQTHIITTEYPDGRKITETFILNKDTLFVTHKESSNKEINKKTETSKEKITINKKSQWSFGVSANSYVDDFDIPNYGIMLGKRVLGPFHLGIQGDITGQDKRYGLFLRMEF